MAKMVPGLTICMSLDGQSFVLIHNCVHPHLGCAAEYGPLERLARQVVERNGLASVLRSLNEHPRRQKLEKSELKSLPVAEQNKFDRRHKQVSLSLQKGSELWLAPMHLGKRGGRIGGRIGGDMSETHVVRLPTTPQAFFDAVKAAMALAD